MKLYPSAYKSQAASVLRGRSESWLLCLVVVGAAWLCFFWGGGVHLFCLFVFFPRRLSGTALPREAAIGQRLASGSW